MTRRKRYSGEFKREALRRANEEGVTDVLVAGFAIPTRANMRLIRMTKAR